MRYWSYGTNPLPEFQYGLLCLEELPWYLWLIDKLADWLCGIVPAIPFPAAFPKKRDSEDDHISTLRDYYGDLSQFVCCRVHTPIAQWVFTHPKRREYQFEVGYTKLKSVLYSHSPEVFDRQDCFAKEVSEEQP